MKHFLCIILNLLSVVRLHRTIVLVLDVNRILVLVGLIFGLILGSRCEMSSFIPADTLRYLPQYQCVLYNSDIDVHWYLESLEKMLAPAAGGNGNISAAPHRSQRSWGSWLSAWQEQCSSGSSSPSTDVLCKRRPSPIIVNIDVKIAGLYTIALLWVILTKSSNISLAENVRPTFLHSCISFTCIYKHVFLTSKIILIVFVSCCSAHFTL